MKVNGLFSLLCVVAGGNVAAFQSSLRQRQPVANPHRLPDGRLVVQRVKQRQQQVTPTFVQNTDSSSLLATTSEPAPDSQELDVAALGKYAFAVTTQMAIFYALFSGVDYVVNLANLQVPFAVNCVVFWFVALKSRVLNPLNNTRPQPANLEAPDAEQRNMPSWTPPGVVFPIMWILIIGPIRAATTAMVYSVTGCYAHAAILSLMLHLSIGDVWNTINNVERRYGASVIGVLLVWMSKAFAAAQYYQVLPLAGKLLCLPLVWLTIASALIIRTWQLNPDEQTGEPYPLYPVKGQGETELSWFPGGESS